MPLEHPQAIRTVFFDAGFTLIHPYPSTPEICQRVCRQLELHIHLDAVRDRMIAAQDYFFRQFHRDRYTWGSDDSINEFWTTYYMDLLRPFLEEQDEVRLYKLANSINEEFDKHTSWQTFEDVIPTLDALKKGGYTLGVISDWGIALGPILHRLRLTRYFDCVLISAVARHAKPSPMLYELALKRANAIADYSLHIGDTYIQDVLGARSVGITPILLDRPKRLQKSVIDCLLVNSLDELLDLLEVSR